MCVCISVLCFSGIQASDTRYNRELIFEGMKTNDTTLINKAIEYCESRKDEFYVASGSALKMKKAGYLREPKARFELFNKNKKILESCIEKSKTVIEFRLLRLMIQEHAPPILNYKSNREEDAKYIKDVFEKADASFQPIIKGYAERSEALQKAGFKTSK